MLSAEAENVHALHNRAISYDKIGRCAVERKRMQTRKCAHPRAATRTRAHAYSLCSNAMGTLVCSGTLALPTVGTTRYSEAIADFSAVIRLDPSNANAYFNRGSVRLCAPPCHVHLRRDRAHPCHEHLRRDCAHACHICAGTGAHACHICARDWASPLPHLRGNCARPCPHLRRDWGSRLPHLRRDWGARLPHLRQD